jgi:hypothetical protein
MGARPAVRSTNLQYITRQVIPGCSIEMTSGGGFIVKFSGSEPFIKVKQRKIEYVDGNSNIEEIANRLATTFSERGYTIYGVAVDRIN